VRIPRNICSRLEPMNHPLTRPGGHPLPRRVERDGVRGARFTGSFNHQNWTRIGAMNLPSELVLVPRPSSSGSIFRSKDGFEDEDEGRGRAREHLAKEQFMENGNEANSNPRRTTIPGAFKPRESPGRAGGFPI
jgi:hypothetical protein